MNLQAEQGFHPDLELTRPLVGEDKTIITDVRYSAVPNEVDGLWGIKIIPSKNKNDHVEWVVNRADYGTKLKKFIDLIKGNGCKRMLLKN